MELEFEFEVLAWAMNLSWFFCYVAVACHRNVVDGDRGLVSVLWATVTFSSLVLERGFVLERSMVGILELVGGELHTAQLDHLVQVEKKTVEISLLQTC